MPRHEYSFLASWAVDGATIEGVYAAIIEGCEYVRWWPQVYLAMNETAAGGEHGLGKAANLHTKGRLPYALRWRMQVVDVNYPRGFTISADGDFVGRGVWTFDRVDVSFDWRLAPAEKPLIRRLSWLFKPLFAYNHRWAMARGEEGLQREVARIRGQRG